jgi:valyl-tRNA synthetase
LWQVGVDHAGIATEMVVTRQIEAEGKASATTSRAMNSSTRCGTGRTIRLDHHLADAPPGCLGRLVARAFHHEPEDLSEAVIETFVRLHEEGKIYRGPRLVNWDPVLQTAISDLEVVNSEEQGKLWSIRYPRTDGRVMSSLPPRDPETLLGDVCVAVHPDDERYADLVGKTVELPLTGRANSRGGRRIRRHGIRHRLRQDHPGARLQ